MSFNWSDWHKKLVAEPFSLVDIPLIAEAGINHNGDLKLALDLVQLAHETGCSAVKFQKREPEICVPLDARSKIRETPWGVMTYFEYKKRIELNLDDYRQIDKVAKNLGITWFVSSWDVESQRQMREFDFPINKVASAMLTHLPLLTEIASEQKLTFVSTGMSTLSQISSALKVFDEARCPVILMHTISSYPADERELNLRVIETLRQEFGKPVGYSGHESSVSPSIVAAALGAVAIERHITLDRSMWGTDQAASLEKSGISALVGALRKIPVIVGDGRKEMLASEMSSARNLRYFE